ncbi:MAG: GNAT family N-acetyltransferase [Eubacterium sp.]
MIRNITKSDRKEYIKMAREFYSSPAVLNCIPIENIENTFDELMRSDEYAEAFIFEKDSKTAGYALLAKTFSQEAGGLVIWIEEIFIKNEFRGLGLGGEFIEKIKNEFPAARLRLEVEPDNERVVSLYEKHGFKRLDYINYYLEKK